MTTLLVGGAGLAGVGFLGGFTTFSTFSVQIVLEVDGGRTDKAVVYLVASVAGGIAAAALGFVLGRRLADAGYSTSQPK